MAKEEQIECDPYHINEIMRFWRRDWSDRSRSETLASKGPGFFLWRSKSDGMNGSGMFYTKAMVKNALFNPDMANKVDELIDKINHDESMVVVLGFEEQEKAFAMTVDKLSPPIQQEWFEMPEVIRRSLSRAVWIPLRVSEVIVSSGKYGFEGDNEEYLGLGSVMFPTKYHQDSLDLGWSDIGISNNYTGGEVTTYLQPGQTIDSKELFGFSIPRTKNKIRLTIDVPSKIQKEFLISLRAGEHHDYKSDAIGTSLVIEQRVNSVEKSVWHLHQDFVLSLNLLREGDKWLRPDEGYLEIARLNRDEEGEPVKLEVRAEHLRDYLCARDMNLYISSYRSRRQVCADRSHISWETSPIQSVAELHRWEGHITEIHEGGTPYGSSTAVFHVARSDVDDEEDVPHLEFPSDDSVKTDSWTKTESGRKLFRIEGELWRTEIVDAGDISERIRGDDPQRPILFIVDAAGNTESKETLTNSDSKWLWFRPEVMREILGSRGAKINWYTKDTGSIGVIPGSNVHFGINELGLINVYAKDIGLLSNWEQRKWVSFNIGPDGKVSKELLDSQMRASPAATQAPEHYLKKSYDAVNYEISLRTGRKLFGEHQAIEDLFSRSHRFRALNREGLLELAKDLARLTVENIDGTALNSIASPPDGVNVGSIKHLEAAVATRVEKSRAREITAVLVGINELRQADAHLPSSDLEESISLAGISETGISINEAQQMLRRLVDSLFSIAEIFSDV